MAVVPRSRVTLPPTRGSFARMDDQAGAEPETIPTVVRSARQTGLIAAVIASAFFMEGLDSTVIATALPQIAHSFGEPALNLTAAVTSYLLSLAVFIPISGWVADRFGIRNVFCAAVLVFTVSSVLCGASHTLDELVAMRILQGLGGSMMTPVGRLIMLRSFPKSEIIRAVNYITIPALIGPSIGPIVGGFFVVYFNWRWIFYINLPIGIAAAVLAWCNIVNFRAPIRAPFDFKGFAICGLGLAALQYALENTGRHMIGTAEIVLLYVFGGCCLLGYGFHARRAANPAVDLSLFRIRTFRIGMLTGALIRMPMGATPFILPLLLQICFGYTPLESGLHTACLSVGAVISKTATKVLLRRFGYRIVLVANSVLVGFSLIGIALFSKDTPSWLLAVYILGIGWIRSVQFTSASTLSYSDMPSELSSKASSIVSVAQQLSQSIGVAAAAALLALLSAGSALDVADFRCVFVGFGVFAIAMAATFLELRPEDGNSVSGYHAPGGRTA